MYQCLYEVLHAVKVTVAEHFLRQVSDSLMADFGGQE
jgi:hypothetical protein